MVLMLATFAFLIAGMFFPDLMSGGGGSHSSGMPPMFAD